MGLSNVQLRAMVQRNLSNDLPGVFARPAFEPHLFPISDSTGAPSGSGGNAHRCHAPSDGRGYVFAQGRRGRRRGGVRG